MDARTGDRLVVKNHHLGDPDREATVLEVLGRPGSAAHYRVEWTDGHQSVFFPSADCTVVHPEIGVVHG